MNALRPMLICWLFSCFAFGAAGQTDCIFDRLCSQGPGSNATVDSLEEVSIPAGCINGLPFTQIHLLGTNQDLNPTPSNEYQLTINVNNIVCTPADTLNTVSAMLIQIPPVDQAVPAPCEPSTFLSIISCTEITTNSYTETFSFPDIQPASLYALIIASNVKNCSYNATMDGTSVGIQTCCDGTVDLGGTHEVQTTVGSDSYTWSPADDLDDNQSPTPAIMPTEEGEFVYTVSGFISTGCLGTDQITVFVNPPFSAFEIITPNGDGLNDTWVIVGIDDEAYSSASVTIFDRWGQVVFKSIGYNTPWDGTRNGNPLPSGTYYYVIDVNRVDVIGKPLTGFVAIVR